MLFPLSSLPSFGQVHFVTHLDELPSNLRLRQPASIKWQQKQPCFGAPFLILFLILPHFSGQDCIFSANLGLISVASLTDLLDFDITESWEGDQRGKSVFNYVSSFLNVNELWTLKSTPLETAPQVSFCLSKMFYQA